MMPRFSYRLRSPDGRTVDGVLDAEDRLTAARQLSKDGTLIKLGSEKHPLLALLETDLPPAQGVAASVRLTVLRELSILLQAGLSVEQALALPLRGSGPRR